MARKALVQQVNGFVVNIIELELDSTWMPPTGHVVLDALDGGPGDTWNGTIFVKPPPAPPPPLTEEQIAWAAATVATKISMVGKRLGFE